MITNDVIIWGSEWKPKAFVYFLGRYLIYHRRVHRKEIDIGQKFI